MLGFVEAVAVQNAKASLFDELDTALRRGTPERRVTIFRRVTDLFLYDANRLNEKHVDVFDDVLCHLIREIETKALVEISSRLAPIDNAPIDLTRQLAGHHEIAVAGPVLSFSNRLATDDLVAIAKTKSQAHLFAISERPTIAAPVTDVLLDRGNRAVIHNVAVNSGASLSSQGFATLVKASASDDSLAEKAGLRLDLPPHILKELLLRATDAVRSRLLSRTPPELQEEVRRALQIAASEIDWERRTPRDFVSAKRFVDLLKERGELNEAVLLKFAMTRRYEETTAALASLSSAPIEIIKPLMESPRDDGLLIPCKAAGCAWETLRAILACKIAPGAAVKHLKKLEADFAKLSRSNAQRLLRFWQIRQIGPTSH
ncbi:DUF2336 domain-containing protein [Bradyrhizobium sp. SYSU BS000235]|uniref:DUF2336 domain-containing protein n=1 Tax=Bradyrhizobium sp. SYSU BS000235 TaxID=3411332 RepID=UPI003C79416B